MRLFKTLIKEKNIGRSTELQMSEILEALQRDVDDLTQENRAALVQQFAAYKHAFERALAGETEGSAKVVSSESMMTDEFGLEFLSYVDPKFVRDVSENSDWYLTSFRESLHFSGYNEILLNVGYPSRTEREFLKHVEHAQQRKNDAKYHTILKALEAQQSNSGGKPANKAQPSVLPGGSRAIGAQEDA